MEYSQSSHAIRTQRVSLPLQRPEILISKKKLQNMNCILSQNSSSLFLGDIISTLKTDLLKKHKITAILSCLSDEGSQKHLSIMKTSKIIQHFKIVAARDVPEYPLNNHFQQTYNYIEQARNQGHNILVHCHAGLSRSATIVCAYLMRKNKWTTEHALEFIKQQRNRIRPNQGFLKLLKQFQIQIMNQNHVKLPNKMANSTPKQLTQQFKVKNRNSRCLQSIDNLAAIKKDYLHIQRNSIRQNRIHSNQKNIIYMTIAHKNRHLKSPSTQFTNTSTRYHHYQIPSQTSFNSQRFIEKQNPSQSLNHSVYQQSFSINDSKTSLRKTSESKLVLAPMLSLNRKGESQMVRNKNESKKKFGTAFKNRILSKAQSQKVADMHILTSMHTKISRNYNKNECSPHKNLFASFETLSQSVQN